MQLRDEDHALSGEAAPRVLSLQSHVVHGYVGNRAAVFPLQLLGFEVDYINSVQFSNHTGYNTVKGQILDGEQLWSIVEGLEQNGLLAGYDYLLTGYIGSESFLRTVLNIVQKLKEYNPNLIYICDPVLGDLGPGLYVPKDLISIYREEMMKVCSVITPNCFEAQLLSDTGSITSMSDAIEACDSLHSKGVEKVVITSLELEPGCITMVCSLGVSTDRWSKKYYINLPQIQGHFTGTGDLTTAMLLAWMHNHPYDLPSALEKVGAVLQAVRVLNIFVLEHCCRLFFKTFVVLFE